MKLYAYRCRQCGRRTYPARLICDCCGGRDFEPEPLEGTVTLLTHTRVHCLPEGINRPYLDFGLVEFEMACGLWGSCGCRVQRGSG